MVFEVDMWFVAANEVERAGWLHTMPSNWLDLDVDYGCLSKGKIPRRGETPLLY